MNSLGMATNTDGSSTTAVSNSFLSPLEKSHSGRCRIIKADFSSLYCKWYVVCTYQNRLDEAILIRRHNIPSCSRKSNRNPYFAFLPGATINTH